MSTTESKKFENRIEHYEDPAALYRKDPTINGVAYQRPYLYVRWGSEPYVEARVETSFEAAGVSMDLYNALASEYCLPLPIDATWLRGVVDERVIPTLERMNRNREEFWNGSTMVGRVIDEGKETCHDGMIYAALWEIPELSDQEMDQTAVRDIQRWDRRSISYLRELLNELHDGGIIDPEDIPVAEKYKEQVKFLRVKGIVVCGCDTRGQYLTEDWEVRDIPEEN